jgi:hypothetical protein
LVGRSKALFRIFLAYHIKSQAGQTFVLVLPTRCRNCGKEGGAAIVPISMVVVRPIRTPTAIPTRGDAI